MGFNKKNVLIAIIYLGVLVLLTAILTIVILKIDNRIDSLLEQRVFHNLEIYASQVKD